MTAIDLTTNTGTIEHLDFAVEHQCAYDDPEHAADLLVHESCPACQWVGGIEGCCRACWVVMGTVGVICDQCDSTLDRDVCLRIVEVLR